MHVYNNILQNHLGGKTASVFYHFSIHEFLYLPVGNPRNLLYIMGGFMAYIINYKRQRPGKWCQHRVLLFGEYSILEFLGFQNLGSRPF